MPRPKTIISSDFPYHIIARSNNKAAFPISLNKCWNIFYKALNQITNEFNFRVHSFVLMNNHYHLIGSTDQTHPLPKIMQWLQLYVTKEINKSSKRINHIFGGPYKASLIKNQNYYYHAHRYVYQNPVRSKITLTPYDYKFSTLTSKDIIISPPDSGIECLIPNHSPQYFSYINNYPTMQLNDLIKKTISKNKFQFPSQINRSLKKEIELPRFNNL